MHIGIISAPWVPVPPAAYGGLEAVVDRLARGLVHAGHEVLLAAPANSQCPVPQVAGMDEVDPEAPINGDTITELAHVTRAYAAMTDLICASAAGVKMFPFTTTFRSSETLRSRASL